MLYPDFIENLKPYLDLKSTKNSRYVSKTLSKKITRKDVLKKRHKFLLYHHFISILKPYLPYHSLVNTRSTSRSLSKAITKKDVKNSKRKYDKLIQKLGLRLFANVSISIGGQEVDSYSSEYLDLWNKFS